MKADNIHTLHFLIDLPIKYFPIQSTHALFQLLALFHAYKQPRLPTPQKHSFHSLNCLKQAKQGLH